MDLNSSLDDIIGSRSRHPPRRRPPPTGGSSSIHRPSYSSSRSSSRGTFRHGSPRHDDSSHRSDLRSRISYSNRTGDRHRCIEKQDLRGRIGKHGISNGGLTTASLPNRQRYQQRGGGASSYSYDNNDSDMKRQDPHGLIITKTVNQRGASPSSHSSTSSLARISKTGAGKGRVEVDPTSIVITKKIENTREPAPSPSPPPPSSSLNENKSPNQQQQQQQHDMQQQQILQQIHEAERMKQYLQQQQQQQEEQQLRQQMDRHLQHQLQSQRELILDLQRQLDQRTQQSLVQQQQQQTMHLGGSNFSFRPPVNNNNNNNQYNPGIPAYNRSAPNIVLISNLDPNATANDVKTACGAFGPVTRCELIMDSRGRSCGEAEVEYLDRQSALDCIAKFDNEYVDDRLIRATLRQPPPHPMMRSVIAPTRTGYRTTSQVLYTSKRP